MSTGEAEENKAVLNPEFKRKIVELKGMVKNEFNIQLSMDKLALDEQYRLTVFEELTSLDNKQVTYLIKSLQNTPVYLAPLKSKATKSLKPTHVQQVAFQETTKSNHKLLFSTLALACIMFTFFVLIQTNIIEINLTNSLNETAKVPLVQEETVKTGGGKTDTDKFTSVKATVDKGSIVKTNNDSSNATSVTSDVDSVTAEAGLQASLVKHTPIITLPIDDPEISMRLHGSNTVGEHLAPALLEAYLASRGVIEMQWVKGDAEVERQLQYIENSHGQQKVFAIELHAHGSSTAFKDLLAGNTDIGMASRPIKDKEVEALKPRYGNLGLAGNEFIISLDGLATIVNPQNPLTKLTSAEIAQIFSGEVTNWQQLGGEDLAINVYARDKNSGTWDTFKNLVLKPQGKVLTTKAQRFESSSELSALVAADKAGIGFIGLPYINNSKALSIAATQWSNPIYPTRFTVSTEDYPLARRLYMYAPSSVSQLAKDFTQFTISSVGQNVVEKVGLVSQNIKLETPYKIKGAPKSYNDYTEIANRLSVNFRFKSGGNQLDNKGQRDVLRLVDYMLKNQGRRIVLMGFSDGLGEAKKNIKLSLMRANVLEQELASYGLNITAVEGFGAELPIASNKTAVGRGKNRRVEVWVF